MRPISGVLFCFCFLCVTFVCWCLTEWCLGACFYTCPCGLQTFCRFIPGGLGGWSVLIALMAFPGFGFLAVLEEYQRKGGELTPLCYPSPNHSPFTHCCQTAKPVFLGFSLSPREAAVASCHSYARCPIILY